MSEKNVEIVKRAMNAFVGPKPDFETINALFHHDHVWVPVDVETREVAGAGGYKAWSEEYSAVMPFKSGPVETAIDVGPDTVLAAATLQFHGAASGIDFEQQMWLLITVTDGRITRSEGYLHREQALEAAGLSE